MFWLVTYLFNTGQASQALRIAREAADVYSFGGLVTYADALDRSGDVGGAEQFYRKARERYGNEHKEELLAFLLRHQGENERYRREAHELMSEDVEPGRDRLFENAPQKVSRSQFSGSPVAGVRIVRPGIAGLNAGLHEGDIIVSIDDTRVHNVGEYNVMKDQA